MWKTTGMTAGKTMTQTKRKTTWKTTDKTTSPTTGGYSHFNPGSGANYRKSRHFSRFPDIPSMPLA